MSSGGPEPKLAVQSGLANRFEGVFYSKSDEKFTVRALLDEIFGERKFQYTLDVGPGPGHVSEPLARRSKQITMVEKLAQYEPLLNKRFENARVIIQPIADTELDEKFDVILFSHVLYYHPEASWLELTAKLYEMLAAGGELIIVCNADYGDWWKIVGEFWDELRPHIGFHYVPLSTFRKQCATLGPVKTHPYRYQMWVEPDAWSEFISKQMLELVDDDVIGRYEQRFAQLKKSFKQIDGSYVLDMRCEIIRVMKR
jgi:SAM-dependent methyltransferase